jgi:cardiolipin synthase
LTPLIVAGILNGYYSRALALCFVAGVTDALDGWLARRLGVESAFGMALDPIADKVMQVSVFVAMGLERLVPIWLVLLVFGRDLLILVMAAVLLITGRRGDFPPSLWGKISTIIQIGTAVIILAQLGDPLEPFGKAMTAVATAWSGIHYCWRTARWAAGSIQRKPEK